MKRYILIAVLCALFYKTKAQGELFDHNRITIYPINLAYLPFNRLVPSIEVPVKNHSFLLQYRYNNRLIFEDGKGHGFGFQTRINMNRNQNLYFNHKDYFGFEFTYDKIIDTGFDGLNNYYRETIGTYFGGLVGFTVAIKRKIVFDFYGSIGYASFNHNSNNYSYGNFYLYGNLGLQFGLKL